MKHIVYINNYITEDIIKIRNNERFFSQPANNKILNLVRALESAGVKTTVISSALSSKGKKWHSTITGNKISNSVIIYSGVLGFPLINTFSSVLYIYKIIKQIHIKDRIDRIIFYNFKPEAAWPAYLSNKYLGIPISVEFEDGYMQIEELSSLKRYIFSYTEQIVTKKVDKVIVANTQMMKQFLVPSFVLRGVVSPAFYGRCKSYKKLPNDVFTIFYSGGLDKSRGIQILLEAMKYVNVPCKLQITGKGTIEHVDDRIEHLGFLEYDRMLQNMMQADLLMQCQLVNDTFANVSFPSKLFEYIATGNYVISSLLPDVKDFAGDNFIYYQNDDPKELAEKIEYAYRLWKTGGKNNCDVIDLCENNLPEAIGKKLVSFLN